MIKFTKGNILDSNTEAIVNTVNCIGIMGRGIALQFRKAYPDNFKSYEKACKNNQVNLGSMFIYDTGSMINPRYIVNFPTKLHWKSKSSIKDIKDGLKSLVEDIRNKGIKSISIPPLGCGLGGLRWENVVPLVKEILEPISDSVDIIIFEPVNTSTSQFNNNLKDQNIPKMTIGRSVLIALMKKYLQAIMDTDITLLELQKLMYFMQEAGESLKLRYEKAHYGPYAKNLGNVLSMIEGHFITGYYDGGDDPQKSLTIKKDAIIKAEEILKENIETLNRFNKVAQLIKGFETPYGMELLSTVHWCIKHEEVQYNNLVNYIHSWNKRKRIFSKEHITIAYETLFKLNWV